VGIENAMFSCTVCDPWSAYEALKGGLITEVVPALKVNGEFIPNPMVYTDQWVNNKGQIVYGKMKTGDGLAKGKELMKAGEMDLSLLDQAVERLCTKLMMLMPNCLSKTLNSLRKHKLEHWDRNKESNRDWLALNMMTEAKAGFRAFNEGPKDKREVDFIKLRQMLADGHEWNDDLIRAVSPQYQ
jgi:6-oxo-cyclohex-1-ene-carbonyl-CoA hydrolase